MDNTLKNIGIQFHSGEDFECQIAGDVIIPHSVEQQKTLFERLGNRMILSEKREEEVFFNLSINILYYHLPSKTFRNLDYDSYVLKNRNNNLSIFSLLKEPSGDILTDLCSLLKEPINDIDEIFEWLSL